MKSYYEQDGITIYCGDAREIVPELNHQVDVIVSDPPYGVFLGEVDNGQARLRNTQPYSRFSDTPEYLEEVVVPTFRAALARVGRALITPGNRNSYLYPKPDDVGVWYNPAGTGRGKWGYIPAHLILFYGTDPRAGRNATASSTSNKQQDDGLAGEHPCPKPLAFARWTVEKASLPGETVLDLFGGSGTTMRACLDCGRAGVMVEIEERYCETAAKRLRQGVLLTA